MILGLFLALFHAVWSICVALMPMMVQDFVNWILVLHHINLPYTIIVPFVVTNAIILVVLTFIIGYIFGWVLGYIRDLVLKKTR